MGAPCSRSWRVPIAKQTLATYRYAGTPKAGPPQRVRGSRPRVSAGFPATRAFVTLQQTARRNERRLR